MARVLLSNVSSRLLGRIYVTGSYHNEEIFSFLQMWDVTVVLLTNPLISPYRVVNPTLLPGPYYLHKPYYLSLLAVIR